LKFIQSPQNRLIRNVAVLQQKSRERNKQGLFTVEGLNEIRLCLQAGFALEHLLFCPEWIEAETLQKEIGLPTNEALCEVSSAVLSPLMYRTEVRNALAVFHKRSSNLQDVAADSNGIYLIAESMEKPGNVGALLRTADAIGATAVILTGGGTDLYNPNVIRSSVGCVFTLPVIQCSNEDAFAFLAKHNIKVYTTFMEEAVSSWNADLKAPIALVVGTESTGLSQAWRQPGYTNVNIPMMGKVDSLNVSVAASLLLYEARRQNK
jgi:TrmH family RNA methyltransferase